MDKDELWNQMLSSSLENVSSDDPKSVILHFVEPLGIFGDQLILTTTNEQVQSWVSNNYIKELEEIAYRLLGTSYTINIITAEVAKQPSEPEQAAVPSFTAPVFETAKVQQPMTSAQPAWMNTYVVPPEPTAAEISPIETNAPAAEPVILKEGSAYRSKINRGEQSLFSKCTFETFVVGKSNELARGAALAVAEQPGIAYNPLFIYGSSGLGKTHLLVAIANYALQNYPKMRTLYVPANTFLNDYVQATQTNRWAPFNSKYHQVDLLLVDDVQYLEKKGETITQLFNIFNEMTNQDKQIVLSADRAPKDIDMDERMLSRFVSGLLADVQKPDYETRLAILKNFLARAEQTTFFGVIPEDVLSYLAEASTSNIREMEGAITRLVGNMTLCKKTSITVDEAKEILQDFFPDITNKQIDITTIQHEVERYFGISHEDIISSKRSKGITYPRHVAIYLSRYMTEESLEAIGRKFGGRDHTTVMHSVNKIEMDQKDNRTLFDQIEQLTIKIKERS